MSSNPNNCTTCDYKNINIKQLEADKAHCYMFREEPTEVCRQHTGNSKVFFGVETIGMSRFNSDFAKIFG
jgi:hypothetical protein